MNEIPVNVVQTTILEGLFGCFDCVGHCSGDEPIADRRGQ